MTQLALERFRSMTTDDSDRSFVGYISHFLVSLGCISASSRLIPPVTEQKFFTSGFVLELGASWYLVTAGHVFNQIRDYRTRHQNLTYTFVVHAGFGTYARTRELTRFEYRDPVFCEDRDAGLDFGAISLSPAEKEYLRGNGVVAVAETAWDHDMPAGFDEYALLGLPFQNMEVGTPGRAALQPVFLRVEAVQEVPQEYAHHTDLMRYFRVMEPSRPDLDIKGMSGCPVLAFRQREGQDVQALVCGVQSSWLPGRRVLRATDLRYAARLLREAVRSS